MHDIPSKDGGESMTSIIPVAAAIRASGVVDARQTVGVQDGVDEAECGLSKQKHGLLVAEKRSGDGLGDSLLVEHVVEPHERAVLIGGAVVDL